MLTFATPQLEPFTAYILSFSFSALYVVSIYVSAKTRLSFNSPQLQPPPNGNGHDGVTRSTPSTLSASSRSSQNGPREKMKDERWRDDPEVIKARLVAVCLATLICCAAVFYILSSLTRLSSRQTTFEILRDLLIRLGFISSQSLKPHLITPVLFFGPLYATFLAQVLPGQKYWSWDLHIRRELWSWQGIRNVILAPPTEEIVFRSCVLAILHLGGVSKNQLIFVSPLSFGLAHVHHAWEVFNRYGRTSQAAVRALTVTLFQLGYTTLFGCYTAYLFLRTSSIYAPISAHMFCNYMGFPRIGYELQMFPKRKIPIIIAYILGMLGFIYLLPRWTLTRDSFYWANYLDTRTAGYVY